MALKDIRKAFIDWVAYVTNFGAGYIIWSDQNMPRPNKPYITLQLTSFNIINENYHFPPNNEGHSLTVGDREFTLSLRLFGDLEGRVDPIETLLNLHMSLSDITAYSILKAQGIVYVDNLLGPTDAPSLKSTEYERSSILDLLMRIPWSSTDTQTGVIETVQGTGIIKDPGNQTIHEIDLSITSP